MKEEWINIDYRDFHDVPRLFVLHLDNHIILADCVFDEGEEEYTDTYKLFELNNNTDVSNEKNWDNLIQYAVRELGNIQVSDVVFDDTKRQKVLANVFRQKL